MRWKAGLKYATLLPQRKWQFDSDRVIGQPGKETDLWITDDIIQKSHIEKELLSHLDGIKTVFDGGAGGIIPKSSETSAGEGGDRIAARHIFPRSRNCGKMEAKRPCQRLLTAPKVLPESFFWGITPVSKTFDRQIEWI